MYKAEVSEKAREATQLPKPQGYKVLIVLPDMEEKTEGGVYLTQEHLNKEEVASIFGFVVELGPDAYSDSKRFPTGPYCKKGDWVLFRSYGGTRIKIRGKEFRLINDDSVEAVVEDPRGYERV